MEYRASILDLIPDVTSLPEVGDTVTSPDGYSVEVTRITPVSDYLVIAGKTIGITGYNLSSTAWPVRLEVGYVD